MVLGKACYSCSVQCTFVVHLMNIWRISMCCKWGVHSMYNVVVYIFCTFGVHLVYICWTCGVCVLNNVVVCICFIYGVRTCGVVCVVYNVVVCICFIYGVRTCGVVCVVYNVVVYIWFIYGVRTCVGQCVVYNVVVYIWCTYCVYVVNLFIWFLHPPYGVSQTTSRLREKIQTEDHSDGVTVLFLKKPLFCSDWNVEIQLMYFLVIWYPNYLDICARAVFDSVLSHRIYR